MTDDEPASPMQAGMQMARRMMADHDAPSGPMAMAQAMAKRMTEAGQAPPPMMQMCMGMCAEMLTALRRTTDLAAFATPELRGMFAEWLEALESRALDHLRAGGAGDCAGLAEALGIGEDSAAWLLAHLARAGKVQIRAAAG